MTNKTGILLTKAKQYKEESSTFLTGGNIMIRVIRFPRQEFKAVKKGAESKDLWEGAGCLLLLHDILRSVRCSCCC